MHLWTYHNCIPPTRRNALLAWHSFENIIGGFLFTSEVHFGIWKSFDGPELSGCCRAEFILNIPDHLYDGFFNSPVGYRAQYAISPANGIAKNRELVDVLTPRLMTYVSRRPELNLAKVATSLSGADSKLWIDEDEVQSHYFHDSPEIDFAPWESVSCSGAGLRAAVGTRVAVFGSWLNSTNAVRLNPLKANRAEDIHERGFS